jgi:hypothetical protein
MAFPWAFPRTACRPWKVIGRRVGLQRAPDDLQGVWAGGGWGAASGLRDAMAAGPVPMYKTLPQRQDLVLNGKTRS